MRAVAVLALILTFFVAILPILVFLLISFIAAVGIFMFLARMGLLPGFVFKRYRFRQQGDTGAATGRRRDDGADAWSETPGRAGSGVWPGDSNSSRSPGEKSWYQDDQDGEIITLPETALKKDDEE